MVREHSIRFTGVHGHKVPTNILDAIPDRDWLKELSTVARNHLQPRKLIVIFHKSNMQLISTCHQRLKTTLIEVVFVERLEW